MPFSFVELKNNAALVTAIKPAADGNSGIIRLWNPTAKTAEDAIRLSVKVASAQRCNLAESQTGAIKLNKDGTVPVSVPAFGLATVRFAW